MSMLCVPQCCGLVGQSTKADQRWRGDIHTNFMMAQSTLDGVDMASRSASSAACCSSVFWLDAALNKLAAA